MDPTTSTSTSHWTLYALLAVAAALFFLRLDATDLWAPDEPRFAQVADELRARHHGVIDLVVLRLHGEPYTQKPPLYYWLAASFGATTGRVGEVAARLPSAFAAFACIGLTYLLALRISRRPTAALASAAILLTVFRFGHFARRAGLDVMLTGFVLLALLALFRLRDDGRDRGPWFFALHLSLGLAVLTKGPVGLLPIPAYALFLFWRGTPRNFRATFPGWSAGLSLGPALLWIGAAVALTPSGFFDAAVVDNLWGRFFTGTAHVRPWTYYFVHLPVEFLPWTLSWPLAAFEIKRILKHETANSLGDGIRLLLTWLGFCFVFFSLSAGKRSLYLLPTLPAVAILCGVAIDRWLSRRSTLSAAGWATLSTPTLALAGLGCAIILGGDLWSETFPGFAPSPWLGAGCVAIAAAGLVAHLALRQRRASWGQHFVVPIAVLCCFEALVFTVAYPDFDAEKSPAPIARAAAALSEPGRPIAVFDQPALAAGVAYYSGRRVVPISRDTTLDEFRAEGGRVLIAREQAVHSTPALDAFEIVGSSRSGSRKLLLMTIRNAVPSSSRR